MLVDWKAEQDEMKEILGDEYMDYNLVMASTFGLPLGDGAIRGPLKKLIEDYNLPPVVFHRRKRLYYANDKRNGKSIICFNVWEKVCFC